MSDFHIDNPEKLRGDLDPELFERIDWSKLPPMITEAILGQAHEVRSQLLASMETDEDGEPVMPVGILPFDAAGWCTALVAGQPVARVHWTQLQPGVEPQATWIHRRTGDESAKNE